MSEIVVSKFGGTSVADFDAMNRSADIVLSDANVRLVVLSASAGITNLLVALAEGLEPGERFEKLDAIRNIQFAILERLRYPNVIREEIERLLENITVLAEAAAHSCRFCRGRGNQSPPRASDRRALPARCSSSAPST